MANSEHNRPLVFPSPWSRGAEAMSQSIAEHQRIMSESLRRRREQMPHVPNTPAYPIEEMTYQEAVERYPVTTVPIPALTGTHFDRVIIDESVVVSPETVIDPSDNATLSTDEAGQAITGDSNWVIQPNPNGSFGARARRVQEAHLGVDVGSEDGDYSSSTSQFIEVAAYTPETGKKWGFILGRVSTHKAEAGDIWRVMMSSGSPFGELFVGQGPTPEKALENFKSCNLPVSAEVHEELLGQLNYERPVQSSPKPQASDRDDRTGGQSDESFRRSLYNEYAQHLQSAVAELGTDAIAPNAIIDRIPTSGN